ncbi:MAG: hypothetical protein DRI94_00025 [Bacteroidetes bacterium]|nr:MAG: hypothetical protein DRI94_00025 [Bacteroidota bacterium]
MVCKFCGESFDDVLRECPNCGISFDETGVLKEADYICPVCGAENPPGERKCSFCCSLFPSQ